MSVSDRVRDLVAPICTDLGLELYDVEHAAGKVRVTVDKPGGVDLEALSVATRLISRELDERDPVPGRYQLEVSSPGLERPLRTPAHYQRAVGQPVSIRLLPGHGEERRIAGVVVEADEAAVTVEPEGGERVAGPPALRRHRTSPHHLRLGRPAQAGQGTPRRAHPCERRSRGDSVTNIDMVEAVRMLAADRGIPVDTLLQVLADALVTAYKRRPDAADEAEVQIDAETMDIRIYAYDIDEFGELVNGRDDTPDDMGRIAAQTFRQVLSQRIREVERDRKFEEYANREGDIVTGIVQQLDNRYTLLDLGKVEALLPQAEQVPFERPEPGARLKAYIVEVRRTPKGPQIVVSRTHPGLIKRLFELEVPEIGDGVVEIKACAREPGHRTKMAVWSNDHNVDPVGACVGARGRGSGWWSPSCGARRSTSSPSARTSPTSWPRRSRRPRSRRSASTRTPAWPRSSCRTSSSPWPSAGRARTPAWPLA